MAELIYYGYWFSPEMKAIMRSRTRYSRLERDGTDELYKGNYHRRGRTSKNSLYMKDFATSTPISCVRNPDGAGGFNTAETR